MREEAILAGLGNLFLIVLVANGIFSRFSTSLLCGDTPKCCYLRKRGERDEEAAWLSWTLPLCYEGKPLEVGCTSPSLSHGNPNQLSLERPQRKKRIFWRAIWDRQFVPSSPFYVPTLAWDELHLKGFALSLQGPRQLSPTQTCELRGSSTLLHPLAAYLFKV